MVVFECVSTLAASSIERDEGAPPVVACPNFTFDAFWDDAASKPLTFWNASGLASIHRLRIWQAIPLDLLKQRRRRISEDIR